MITLYKGLTYRCFLGNQDGWASMTGGHEPSGIVDADW